jgi:hypothetical protein
MGMSSNASAEPLADAPIERNQQLSLDIERLREQFPHTQDLYREVCVLMFFRHGTTPTANKLYQLVRKGSMSAPAEALATFWENLREKSRVRIEHPDLPQALKTMRNWPWKRPLWSWPARRLSATRGRYGCKIRRKSVQKRAIKSVLSNSSWRG